MILNCKWFLRLLFTVVVALILTLIGLFFQTVNLARPEVDPHVTDLLKGFLPFCLLLLADTLHQCGRLNTSVHFTKQQS